MQNIRKKRIVVRSVVLIISFISAMMLASPCHGYPKMGPAMERDIVRLVRTNSATCPLPPGWKIDNYRFTDVDITVTLKSEKNKKTIVRLSYPWIPVRGEIVGKTLSFRLEIINADSAESRKAALDFCKRIKRNDRIYFFSSRNMINREMWSQYLFRKYIFTPVVEYKLVFVISLILMFFTLKAPLIREYLLPNGTYGRLALLGVFVLGMGLRLYVSPSTPIHCNTHGIREVIMYLSLRNDEVSETAYGRAFPSTMRWILGFIGPEEKNVFLINKILGSLAILAIFLYAKGLTGSDVEGIFSALFFCLSPSQVWMAGTESQIPMYQFIGLSGLGLLCLSGRTRNLSILWLATIMISFASSLRILSVLIVPVAVITGLYLGIHKKKEISDTYSKHLKVCLVIAGAWAAFHYLSIPMMTGIGWSESNPIKVFSLFFFKYVLTFRNTILDPTLTPFIVPLACVAAYYFSWKKDKRFALFVTVVFLIVVPMTFSVLDCRTTAVRYQTQSHWIYYILAASLFTGIAPESFRRRRMVMMAVIVILTIAGSVPGLAMLRSGSEEMNEYRFMRETAYKIPPGTVIRLPVDSAVEGKLITDFPDHLNRHIVVKGKETAPPGKSELIYVGLDCYKYGSDMEKETDLLPDGKRKQCVEICDGQLIPVYETKLDGRHPLIGYHNTFHHISALMPVVGFYECIPDEK